MRTVLMLTSVLLLACPSPGPAKPQAKRKPPPEQKQPVQEKRVPAVQQGDRLYARVEGTAFRNACKADADCHVGGCSSEVCSAEEGVTTTCEVQPWPQARVSAACGCVGGQCIWYVAEAAAQAPGRGMPCPEGRCAQGLTCLTYYGVAGPAGPQFSSCEIPCPGGKGCPKGQSCVTIADGPGQVCR